MFIFAQTDAEEWNRITSSSWLSWPSESTWNPNILSISQPTWGPVSKCISHWSPKLSTFRKRESRSLKNIRLFKSYPSSESRCLSSRFFRLSAKVTRRSWLRSLRHWRDAYYTWIPKRAWPNALWLWIKLKLWRAVERRLLSLFLNPDWSKLNQSKKVKNPFFPFLGIEGGHLWHSQNLRWANTPCSLPIHFPVTILPVKLLTFHQNRDYLTIVKYNKQI